MNHDNAPTDWIASVFGLLVTAWQWSTAGMSPLSIALAACSLLLVILRISESVERRRLMRQFGQVNRGVLRRMLDAISTKPGDLKE